VGAGKAPLLVRLFVVSISTPAVKQERERERHTHTLLVGRPFAQQHCLARHQVGLAGGEKDGGKVEYISLELIYLSSLPFGVAAAASASCSNATRASLHCGHCSLGDHQSPARGGQKT